MLWQKVKITIRVMKYSHGFQANTIVTEDLKTNFPFFLDKRRSYLYLPSRFGEHSSAGSEHLPYKQGVTGSNPVAPTNENEALQ
jgi:hypothetical protein